MKILYFLLLSFFVSNIFAQAGENDTTFNVYDNNGFEAGGGYSANINVIKIQADGKILVGGNSGKYNGYPTSPIFRILPNGARDTSFYHNLYSSFVINDIEIQTDDKILLGGSSGIFRRINPSGDIDSSFNYGSSINGNVNSILCQPDGKIIVSGEFTTFGGISVNRIVRLNINGSKDTTFNVGTGANNAIYCMVLQPDGKIVIGGNFTQFNGININRIARLNNDGSLDTNFMVTTGANNSVLSIRLQPDDKILIGGSFTQYNSGANSSRLTRLNNDGSRDLTFNAGTGPVDNVKSIIVLPDNKIIVAGIFTQFNGNSVGRIVRLNEGGIIDTSYLAGIGANNSINSSILMNDGSLMIAGMFTSFNDNLKGRICKLFDNGELDVNFCPQSGANHVIWASAFRSTDSKIFIGGDFTMYNNKKFNRYACLNYDGSIDTNFVIGSGPSSPTNPIVKSFFIQPDNKILVGGNFNYFNNYYSRLIVRLNPSGSIDSTFMGYFSTGTILSIRVQLDQKILVGGEFTGNTMGVPLNRIARLNSDGTRDTSFHVGTGFNSSVQSICVQSDGKIIIGGYFTTYNGNTCNRIIRLNADGSVDNSFIIGTGFTDAVYSIQIQDDGKILVCGQFNKYNGITSKNLIRLNNDGSVDNSFNLTTISGSNTRIYTVNIQSDNKIIIGGYFDNFNNTSCSGIVRVNEDGIIDTSFNYGVGLGVPYQFQRSVISSFIQPDNKIFIGGDFYFYNNFTRSNLARLNGDNNLPVNINSTKLIEDFVLYPNPTSNLIYIKVKKSNSLNIFDSFGRLVLENKLEAGSNVIDCGFLSSGIYYVKLFEKNSFSTTKLIINH